MIDDVRELAEFMAVHDLDRLDFLRCDCMSWMLKAGMASWSCTSCAALTHTWMTILHTCDKLKKHLVCAAGTAGAQSNHLVRQTQT